MARPLFEGPELRQASQVLGALLLIVSGVVMLIQTYLVTILPPEDGFYETTATVVTLERTGTFRYPAFLVSLSYQAYDKDGQQEEIRSGQRVEFEIYHALSKGDEVQIHYNPDDVYDWRLVMKDRKLEHYALGLIMLLLGIIAICLPSLLRWGSRQRDFELTDEWDNNPPLGVKL